MQEISNLLSQPGIDIEEFVSKENDIFPNATSYPAFLNQNLLSPLRVIKYFPDDPHSNFRLNYQLVLEEGGMVQFPLNNFKEKVFGNLFEIRFSRQSEEQRILFNDFQFKRLLAQFFVLLQRQDQPDIEMMVNKYPIIDIVFIHVLRSLMCTMGIDVEFDTKIQTQTVFGSLCSLLDMGLAKYDNCWKFEDSDMFCLDETKTDLFFIFTLEQGDSNKASSQIYPYKGIQQKVENNMYKNTIRQQNPFENNYLSDKQNFDSRKFLSDFAHNNKGSELEKVQSDLKNDILKLQLSAGRLFSNSKASSMVQQNPHKPTLFSLADVSQKTSFRIDQLDQRKQSFTYNPPNRNLFSPVAQKESFKQFGSQNFGKSVTSFSKTPYPQPTTQFNFEPYKPYNPPSYQPQIYKPSYNANLNYQPSYQPSYQSSYQPNPTYQTNYQSNYPPSYQSKNYKQTPPSTHPSSVCAEYPDIKVISPQLSALNKSLSLSDYYKDFTNSFLLPMIREPYQSNLRGIKNRIKGVRRQNIVQNPF